jgi:uncharacterized repeat protein (TIGR03806 family)
MRLSLLLLALFIAILLAFHWPAPAADSSASKPAAPVGIAKRVPWTTSHIKGSPDPAPPYRTEVAFPKLMKFAEPLELSNVPGFDRIVVVERKGKIYSFANQRDTEKADLLLDLKKTIYGLTFHPQFAKNGYMYVAYVLDPDKTLPKGSRVSRFEVSRDQGLRSDPASEKIIFEWPSGGHNGGSLKFGPDGYLYIGTGDGSGIADELKTGQDISDVLASIQRVDVDHPEKERAYGIPKDNPFVNTPGARPEIWAYGIRQPWKMSFDRATGDLWVGEVGQDLWEMILRVQRGGNYGWSVTEGSHPFRPERKRGPTPILPPVIEHPHSEFRCIIGGYVYHGKRLKELAGAYIYADYDTGKVWGLRFDGQKVTWKQELATTRQRIVAFAEDNAGELLHVDFMGGRIHRLAPAPQVVETHPFPRKLSETGLFTSVKDLQPAPGLIPYSVNAALWSDGAIKERYLAIPGDGRIEYNAIEYPQPAPGAPRGWKFPDGTVMVKTFFLELEPGKPASRRRLETRLLHFQQLAGTEEVGDQYWRGYTYVWNDEQTDATLLDAAGLDRTFTIADPKAPGGKRQQTWHFPSRSECIGCHTMPAKFTLGVNTLQLNRDHDYGGVVANQLRTFEHLGLFTKPLPEPPEKLPRLYDYEDERLTLDQRARSYLHANCAHCHMKWGGGNAEFQLLATLPLKETGTIGTRPGQGALDIPDAQILAPGHPERSIVYQRMKRLGLGRMPHIGSLVVDEKGVKLIQDWIKQLPESERSPGRQ